MPVLLTACFMLSACSGIPGEGEACTDTCARGLACVPDVGRDYDKAADTDICERPHAMYDLIAYGERGENRRVDEALDMIDGSFRMPRFADDAASMKTSAYSAVLADGTALTCTGMTGGKGDDCLVPDWQAYYGTEIAQYDRFYFYGLRMVSSLIYTAYYSPARRLQARYYERTHESLGSDGVKWLRHESRTLALAVLDSFVANGHLAFALERMPACYTGSGGYQNPNAAWSAQLAEWDPATRIEDGRLVQAQDVPVDCTGEIPATYSTLRDSLWYPHAAGYRAMVLANAFYLFRGVLADGQREAWLRVIRETGDALALPSSYEPDQNHGITESAALIQLASDFATLLPAEVTSAWMRLGRFRLNDMMVDTVFSDGVQVEQSPMYHNYELVLLMQILDWMNTRGLDLTSDIDPAAHIDYDTQEPAPDDPDVNDLDPSPALEPRQLIDRMVRASIHIAQPDGWIPWIGSSVPQQYRGYQADVVRRYIDEDRPFSAQLEFFETAGKEGTAPPKSERLVVFEDSGFVTMHSAFKPDFAKQTHVVFNAGLPYHKHSHPDALAVHLFGPDTTPDADTGMALLVDSGWYSYESTGTFFFKSTLAHNTVNVDGKNQCVRAPQHMRFDPYTDGPLLGCAELARMDPAAGAVRLGRSREGTLGDTTWLYQSALHTLYFGVTHRRAVLLVGRDVFVVVDILDSSAPHTFSQTWHLAPRIPAPDLPPDEGGSFHLTFARSEDDPEPLMSLHEATEGAEMRLHFGDAPIAGVFGQGWYSSREDKADPNSVVEVRRAGVSSTAFASVFLLGKRAGQRAEVTLRREGLTSAAVTIDLDDTTIALDIQNLGDAGQETVDISSP